MKLLMFYKHSKDLYLSSICQKIGRTEWILPENSIYEVSITLCKPDKGYHKKENYRVNILNEDECRESQQEY